MHINSKSWQIRKQFFLIALHSDHVDWLALSVQSWNRCLVFALGTREAPVFPVGIRKEGRLLPASPVQQHSAAGKPQRTLQVKTQPFALHLCCSDLHGQHAGLAARSRRCLQHSRATGTVLAPFISTLSIIYLHIHIYTDVSGKSSCHRNMQSGWKRLHPKVGWTWLFKSRELAMHEVMGKCTSLLAQPVLWLKLLLTQSEFRYITDFPHRSLPWSANWF